MSLRPLAKIISVIIGYPWLAIIDLAILKVTLNRSQPLLVLLILLLDVGIPLMMMLSYLKSKRVSDWDITNREERTQILLFITVGSLLSFAILFIMKIEIAYELFFALFAIKLILMIITRYWKISLHLATNTTCCLILSYLFAWKTNWLLIFTTPLLYWSRLYLQKHTHSQLIAGILLSLIIFNLCLYSFHLVT